MALYRHCPPQGHAIAHCPVRHCIHQSHWQSWQPNFQASEFIQLASDLKEYILAGDIFQIVPSQVSIQKTHIAIIPYISISSLRSLNPSPYLFLVDMIDMQMIASSPERGRCGPSPLTGIWLFCVPLPAHIRREAQLARGRCPRPCPSK